MALTQIASAATDTWTGNSSASWNNAGNWTGGNAPPQAGDSLVFGSSAVTTLNNDFAAGMAFSGLTFSGGSAFTLNGAGILISGSTNSNAIAITNNSGTGQILGTMPLMLDRGYYAFSSPAGGSIALNGGLTLNTGGVAYFDANVTSTSLTTDGAGLISGLAGGGLIVRRHRVSRRRAGTDQSGDHQRRHRHTARHVHPVRVGRHRQRHES